MNRETNGGEPTIAQAIIVASLVLGLITLTAIVAFSGTDWFYPFLTFAVLATLVWSRFLAEDEAEDEDIGERLK